MTRPDTNVPRIALPAVPQPAAPFRFPVVAATVPVVASLGIWLITGSTFALIFAALGPLAAVGSYVDSRVTARKKLRAEKLRFARDVVATDSAIDAYHRWESSELAERTPPGVFLVRDVHADSSRWVCEPHGGLLLHLGYGNVRSNLSVDGAAYRDGIDAATAEEYQRLIEYASTLPHAPIAVNAQLGIAIFGSELIALSLARALAIQLARTLSPQTSWVRVQGALSDEQWVSHLPHRVVQSADSADLIGGPRARASVEWGQLDDDSPTISICVVSNEAQVPSGHRIVIGATGQTIAIVGHPDRYQRRDFDPSFLGREQALVWALAAHEIASRDGLTTSRSAVPDSIHFRELLLRRETGVDQRPRRAHSLESRPAAGVRGPFVVDLVASGPHAIVGGTTGSGKSELLISWVLAMAAESSPDEVTFLLVDFKGGSAFAHLARLPHTVGIITDLDDAMANRAFSSLRAELKHRERILAQAGVRDISEFVHLPRLVIVVDEFAAMMADYPQLHALFSDIAARGRSLGVHLILCTQRPSGVMHDSLLANADLRISLRVNNGADSSAVIGSTRAVELPSRTKGRAWVVHGSLPAELVQFALATPSDVLAVAERWPAAHSPRRPWCEPLPGKILLAAVAELSITLADHVASRAHRSSATDNLTVLFGITDLPDEQRQGIAGWSPSSDGHLLVVGAPGSGKSVAIATIAAATSNHPAVDWRGTAKVLVARRDPAAFWDLIAQLHAQLDCEDLHESESSWTLLAIDDLDAIISRFDDEYRAAVLERLARLLREGNAHNIGVVASAQRISPALHSLAQLMPETLRLRIGNREDFVLSGGASIDYNPALPPGGGIWKGVRVQVAISGTSPPVLERTTVPTLQGTENIVIATSRPASATAALAAAGWQVRTLGGAPGSESDLLIADTERPIALVGTIDEWQSRWGALALLRAHATVLLDRCSLSDYRQLTRTRELPPPLTTDAAEFWRVIEGGGADRVRLPR